MAVRQAIIAMLAIAALPLVSFGQRCGPSIRVLAPVDGRSVSVSHTWPYQNGLAFVGSRVGALEPTGAWTWRGGNAVPIRVCNASVGVSDTLLRADSRTLFLAPQGLVEIDIPAGSSSYLPFSPLRSDAWTPSFVNGKILVPATIGSASRLPVAIDAETVQPVALDTREITPFSAPADIPVVGGLAFYSVTTSVPHRLFFTDGTVANTHPIESLIGPNSFKHSDRFAVAEFRGDVYFVVKKSVQTGPIGTLPSDDVFRTRGTVNTTFLTNIPGVSYQNFFAATSEALFFFARADSVTRLCASDGTPSGTRAVPGIPPSLLAPALHVAGSFVLLTSATGAWAIAPDGSVAVDLTPAFPNSASYSITAQGQGGNTLLTVQTALQTDLFITDGTVSGTCSLASSPWTQYTGIADVVQVNHRVFANIIGPDALKRLHSIDLCPPDFNNSGSAPDAQDIFDFLTAFFAEDPRADFNNSGGPPTVQDVFDFIIAWFTGCT